MSTKTLDKYLNHKEQNNQSDVEDLMLNKLNIPTKQICK